MSAASLPPQSGKPVSSRPKPAVEGGLIPELIVQVRARTERAALTQAGRGAEYTLQTVERAFGRDATDPCIGESLAEAKARFTGLAGAAGGGLSEPLALAFAAEVFTALALERPWRARRVEALASRLSLTLGLSRETTLLQLCINALRSPQLFELPPSVSLEAQLAMLTALSPQVVEAGLWVPGADGRAHCLASIGTMTTTRRVQVTARSVLERKSAADDGGAIRGVPVRKWQASSAALVVRLRGRDCPDALLGEAAGAISPILERESLLRRSAAREHSLVQASERRLARLGFDLHDGALQHLAALGIDVHLLRGQVVEGMPRPIVVSRTEDLESRIDELERILRELAHSLEPQSLLRRPLADVLETEAATFSERTGIETSIAIRGEFGLTTPSQKIAVIRVVQEALTNVREHADASFVEITVTESRGHIHAQIRDDGQGFNVARTLIGAAKRGRLGLVGSSERLRLLGGTFDVDSKPGGPTTVSLSLPRWQPLEAQASAPVAAATE